MRPWSARAARRPRGGEQAPRLLRHTLGLTALLLCIGCPARAEDDLGAAVRRALAEAMSTVAAGGLAGVACPGDCNGDGRVSVDELVRAVSVALGLNPAGACPGLDTNRSGQVEVAELVAAVGRLLSGCGGGSEESVCGGPITSTPKLCDLTVSPRITTAFGSLRISFGASDLEGDVVQLCGAIAPQGTPRPELLCETGPADGVTINTVIEVPPIQLMGVRNGTYVLYLQLRDARGQNSAIVSAAFTVGVRA